MKKFLAWLLALTMVLGLAAASAEEAAQAALAQAFRQKIQELISKTPQDHAVTFSVAPQGEDPLTARMQFTKQDELDLTLNVPGMSEPVILQVGQDAAWVSVAGNAFEIRFADVQSILMALTGGMSLPQVDPQVATELVQLLLIDVVMPGLTTDTTEDGKTRIHLFLTMPEMAAGLAVFGDQVMANEKYFALVSGIGAAVAARSGYQGDFAADLAAHWPEMQAQLLAVESDGKLEADLVAEAAGEEGNAQKLTLDASFSMDGETARLQGEAAQSGKETKAQLHLSDTLREQTTDLVDFSIQYNRAVGTLNARLSLPRLQNEFRLTGTVQNGALQCSLTQYRYAILGLAADVTAAYADDALTATVVIHQGMNSYSMRADTPTVISLYWARDHKQVAITANRSTLAFQLDTDREGAFQMALSGSSMGLEAFKLSLDGAVTPNGLQAKLVYAEEGKPAFDADLSIQSTREALAIKATFAPAGTAEAERGVITFRAERTGAFAGDFTMANGRYTAKLEGAVGRDSFRATLEACQSGKQIFKAECTALESRDVLTVNGSLMSGRNMRTFQLQWGEQAKTAVLRDENGRYSLTIHQDEQGKPILIRLENGAYRRGWLLEMEQGKIRYEEMYRQVEITGHFESETEHVMDVAVTNIRPSRNAANETRHALLTTTINENAYTQSWRIQSQLAEEGQEPLLTVSLASTQGSDIDRLAEKNPTRVDAAFVARLMQQLSASAAHVVDEAYPEEETPAAVEAPAVP